MFLKILILVFFISIIGIAAILFTLRIPQLKLPLKTSQSCKINLLDKWLQSVHDKEKFNGVVLLSKQGKIIFSKAYGHNGSKKLNPLNKHSSFNLASVSKQFTAMGIALLKEQGKLDYGGKLSDYIPELSHYKDITVLHLLHHTSGLPDYMNLANKSGSKREIFTVAEMISLFQQKKPVLHFKPGAKFKYSNTGYVLLAEIITRVSKTSFQEFMASHIFKPLNMNDTQVYTLLSDREPSNRVYGFGHQFWLFGGKNKPQDLHYFDGLAGDGGIYSSAHDLNLWHNAMRDLLLVSSETYEKLYTPAQLDNGTHTNYGFGWVINGDNTVEHAGGWQGFTSFIHRDMKKDELIVILDNSSNTFRVSNIGFRFHSIALNLIYFMKTL